MRKIEKLAALTTTLFSENGGRLLKKWSPLFSYLDRGINYGIGGMGFTRMNVATPRGKIEESLAYLFDAAARNGYAVSETLNKWR